MTNTSPRRIASSARACVELAVEADPLRDAQLARERLEPRALRAVADHLVPRVGQPGERAQHVGVALALDEVGERHDRATVAAARRRAGDRCRGARRARRRRPSPRTPSAIPSLLASTRRAAAKTGGTVGQRRDGVEDVAAVDRDDERLGDACAADGVAGRDGVVRVHEVERRGGQRAAQRRGGPAPPRPVGAPARRGHERRVRDLDAVEDRAARLVAFARSERRAARGPARSSASAGTTRCSTTTRTSAPASRAATAWRCAHMPRTGSSARG